MVTATPTDEPAVTGADEPVMPEAVRKAMQRARRRRRRKESGIALIMLAPSLIIFGVFVFYPFIKNF